MAKVRQVVKIRKNAVAILAARTAEATSAVTAWDVTHAITPVTVALSKNCAS